MGRRRLDPDLAAVPETEVRKVASRLYGQHSIGSHAPCQYEDAARKLIARGGYGAADLPRDAKK